MSARRNLSNSAGLILRGTAPCLSQVSFTTGAVNRFALYDGTCHSGQKSASRSTETGPWGQNMLQNKATPGLW
jgi:hypothetical protein